jgi:hypothetical protein
MPRPPLTWRRLARPGKVMPADAEDHAAPRVRARPADLPRLPGAPPGARQEFPL